MRLSTERSHRDASKATIFLGCTYTPLRLEKLGSEIRPRGCAAMVDAMVAQVGQIIDSHLMI